MSDYNRLSQLTTEAWNSQGASARQFAKTEESLQSKLAKLKNAWDEFTTTIANSDLIKTVVDVLTQLLTKVNDLTGSSTIAKLGLFFGLFETGKVGINKVTGALGKLFNLDSQIEENLKLDTIFDLFKKSEGEDGEDGVLGIVDKFKEAKEKIGGLKETFGEVKNFASGFKIASTSDFFRDNADAARILAEQFGEAGTAGAKFAAAIGGTTGALTILGVAAVATAAGIWAYHNSLKYLTKAEEEARLEYQKQASTLEDITKEYETAIARKRELEAKAGSLTFAEQEELDLLKQQTEELKRQKDYQQDEVDNARKEALTKAKKLADKYASQGEQEANSVVRSGPSVSNERSKKYESGVQRQQEQEEKKLKKRAEAAKKIIDELNNYSKEELQSFEGLLEQQLESYDTALAGRTITIQEYLEGMAKYGTGFTNEEIQTNMDDVFESGIELKDLEDDNVLNKIYGADTVAKIKELTGSTEALISNTKAYYDIAAKVANLSKEKGWDSFIEGIQAEGFEWSDANIKALLDENSLDVAEEDYEAFIDYLMTHYMIETKVKIDTKSALKETNKLKKTFDSFQKAYDDFNEEGKVSSDTLNEIIDTFDEAGVSAEEYEDALRDLHDADSLEDMRNSVNNLATAYLNSKEVLSQLDESTKDIYIDDLKAMGVMNAKEVVQSRLIAKEAEDITKKIQKLEASEKNTDATKKEVGALWDEYTALLNTNGVLSDNKYLTDETRKAVENLFVAINTLDFSNYENGLSGLITDLANLSAVSAIAGESYQWFFDAVAKGGVPSYELGGDLLKENLKVIYNSIFSGLEELPDYTPTKYSPSKSSSSGSGGGDGSDKTAEKWENSYDKLYNYLKAIEKAQYRINYLQNKYNLLLLQSGGDSQQLLNNLRSQTKELMRQYLNAEQANAVHRNRMKSLGKINGYEAEYLVGYKDVKDYVKYNKTNLQVEIDWEKISKITDTKLGERIDEAIGAYEEWMSTSQDLSDQMLDAQIKFIEMQKDAVEAYNKYEQAVIDTIVQYEQNQIDELQNIQDAVEDANKKLMQSVRDSIDEDRRKRDNEKTENDIASKQRRLAYLRQDTSGANALEIRQLEKEIADAQESYGDTLVDQKLDDMEKNLDKASEQRQQQIDLLQSQLDFDKEHNRFLRAATDLINDKNYNGMTLGEIYAKVNGWSTMSNSGLYLAEKEFDELKAAGEAGATWMQKNLGVQLKSVLYGMDNEDNGKFSTIPIALQEALTKVDINGNIEAIVGTKLDDITKQLKSIDESIPGALVDRNADENKGSPNGGGGTGGSEGNAGGGGGGGSKTPTQSKFTEKAGDTIKIQLTDKDGKKTSVKNATVSSDGYTAYIKSTNTKGDVRTYAFKRSDLTLENGIYSIKDEKGNLAKDTDLDSDVRVFQAGKEVEFNTPNGHSRKGVGLGYSYPGILYKEGENFYHYLVAYDSVTGKNYTDFDSNKATTAKNRAAETLGKLEGKSNYQDILKALGINQATAAAYAKKRFKTGGLADFTGLAWLDGSPDRPELVLNAKDTENFIKLRDILAKANLSNYNSNVDSSVIINVNVDKITNDYDVDKLVNRVKQDLNKDGRYRNVNVVSRLR